MHPYYKKKYDYSNQDYPVALKYYENAISLPIYPGMDNNDINNVVTAVLKLIDYYKI